MKPVARPSMDRPALAVTLVLAFVQDAVYALIFLSYMNHYLLDVLHTSSGLPGFTLALYGAVKLFVHPVAGRILDRTSPRLVFRMAVGFSLLATALLIGVHSLTAFLVATTLLATGSAATWPLIYDTVARTQHTELRSDVTGLLALAGYVATGAGFAAGVLLANFSPWRLAFVVVLAMFTLQLLMQGSQAFDRRPARELAVRDRPGTTNRVAGLALFGVILFVDYAAVSSLAGVYGPYVRITLGISLLKTTLLLLPAAAAALGALYAASRLSQPHRRFAELAVLFAISAAAAFALAATSDPWLAAIFAIPLAGGLGATGPIIAASIIDQGGPHDRGLVFGTLMSVEGVGAVIGPGATALVIGAFNPRAGLALLATGFAILIPLALVAFRRQRKQTPKPLHFPYIMR